MSSSSFGRFFAVSMLPVADAGFFGGEFNTNVATYLGIGLAAFAGCGIAFRLFTHYCCPNRFCFQTNQNRVDEQQPGATLPTSHVLSVNAPSAPSAAGYRKLG